MTPERWRQVTEIFHSAAAHTPAARSAYLDAACGEDLSLRRDVDMLLDAHARAGASNDVPALGGLLPVFDPGTELGPYRIESLLGAGGMGEVYRATDGALGRTVAIKVLHPGLAADQSFQTRLAHEAQVLAALNHPNIGTIFGLEHAEGAPVLVLEYVEGPTLAERCNAGKLPLEEGLSIARQIASALEAAHGIGIVHRDLKPANVKIRPDGIVKVLDFGIAKAGALRSVTGSSAPAPTGPGVVLGTAAYMSPEQARGEPVDKRADIWAFGCVLFEMLTGRRAFETQETSDNGSAHMPDWALLPRDVPEPVRRLLKRCLARTLADRLHDIADARLEIADALAPAEAPAPSARSGKARWLWLALALSSAAAVAGWATAFRGPRPGFPLPVEFGIMLPDGLLPAHGLTVSPDGRRIAAGVYGRREQIWLHSLDTSDTRPIPGTERASTPFWSPDGRELAFFARGVLRRLNVASGTASEICRFNGVPYGGSWGTDGQVVFAAGGRLFRVPAAGGTTTPIDLNDAPAFAAFPQLLPGGRHVIFYTEGPDGGSIHAASLESGATKRLVASQMAGSFAPPGRLLYVQGTSLMARDFDLNRLELTGEAQVVATDAGLGMLPLTNNLGGVSVSPTGVLAYTAQRGGRPGQLTWFDRADRKQRAIPQPEDGGEYLNPAISPDGSRVAVNRMDPATGNWDIWIVDVDRNVPLRVTFDPATDADPIWAPDGRALVFASNRGGRPGLYRRSIDPPGRTEPLVTFDTPRVLIPSDWSADGRHILFYQGGSSAWSVWALPLSGDRIPWLVAERAYGGRFSPDGRWVAYSSSEAGSFDAFVQRFPEPSAKTRVTTGGGVHPRWASSGSELIYWANPGGVNAVDITLSPQGIRVGRSRSIVSSPVLSLIDGRPHFDVSRNAQSFLLRQPAGPAGPGITVVLGWPSRLER